MKLYRCCYHCGIMLEINVKRYLKYLLLFQKIFEYQIQYQKVFENHPHIFKYNVTVAEKDLYLAIESVNKVRLKKTTEGDWRE